VHKETVEFEGFLAKQEDREILKYSISELDDSSRFTLVSILLALYFNEPCMLKGETSYKTRMIELAASIYDFGRAEPLLPLYISESTNTSALIGGIEPHDSSSYRTYL
jgi:hypothetical protein